MKRWIAVALVALLAVGGLVAAALAAGDANLSAYHDGPRSLSAFRGELEATGYVVGAVAASPLALRDAVEPTQTVLVLAGVERPLDDREVDALESFVRQGGALILADDTGNGNALGRRFGVSMNGVRVIDESFDRNLSLVKLANLSLPGAKPYPKPVIMNVPGYLGVPTPAEQPQGRVLASTSADAFGDLVPNARRDITDTEGPFVVAYQLDVGRGRIVFLSDPDLFADALVGASATSNKDFAVDLVESLRPEVGTILFDESRHEVPFLETAAARALGLAVAATRDPLLGVVSVLLATVAAASLVLLVAPEEHLGHHRSGLDRPGATSVDPPGTRLPRLARLRVRTTHGARVDEDLSKIATDPVLAEVVATENGITPNKDLRDVLQRIRAYGRVPKRGAP